MARKWSSTHHHHHHHRRRRRHHHHLLLRRVRFVPSEKRCTKTSPLLVRQAQWQCRSIREGRARKGHLQAVEPRRQKRYAAARGDPDASPTSEKVHAQHISSCVPPPPVACPNCPPPPRPSRFLHQRFFCRRALFERSKPFVSAAGPVAPFAFFAASYFAPIRSSSVATNESLLS